MKQHAKSKPSPATSAADQSRRKHSDNKHLDEMLDQALEDTFPASDPVALVEPAPKPADDK
jgi:hypothetical protein